MQTRFGPEDEDAFEAAKDTLLASYREARGEGADADGFTASAMLDYKWGYGDGQICEWSRADLEFLPLDHFPRKVTLDEDDVAGVPTEVGDFLSFLDRRGLLNGDPLPALLGELNDLATDFMSAMRDPANFGMAKRLVAGMLADGVDIERPGAIDEWMEDHNARERDAMLGAPEIDIGPLPPVELAPPEALEAAACGSRLLARITAFASYVGDGRKLTQQGHLRLADGRALIELLGYGDESDPTIGDRVFRARSTAELPGLDLVVRWARAAGFIKVRHGRVSVTARGRRLGARPVDDWYAAFRGLLKGDVIAPRSGSSWAGLWDDIDAELLEPLPVRLYGAEGIPVASLHEAAWAALAFEFPAYASDDPSVAKLRRQPAAEHVDRALERTLVELGAVRVVAGTVVLTPMGLWATNRRLREQGERAPVVGELADRPANDLLHACAEMTLEAAEREIRLWVAKRPATAARELAEAARTGDLPMLAIHALGFAGVGAEAEVRGLFAVELLRPMAQLWLVEHGYETPSSLPREVLVEVLIETLAGQLDEEGPSAVVEQLTALGPDGEQTSILELMLRAAHPRASDVLQAIGQHHPSKGVEKVPARPGSGDRRSGDRRSGRTDL